mgnify:CR=1 FL=1
MKRKIPDNPSGIFSAKKRRSDIFNADAIERYIKKYGFGPQNPPLSSSLSAETFRQHYYDKKGLMEFCRSIGISTVGLKSDLNNRIELYLKTGQVSVVQPKASSARPDSKTGLTLDKRVVNYKSDSVTRRFFKKHIPEFTGFSALVQKQIKERLAQGEVFAYQDVIELHKDFLRNKNAAKAEGLATKVAHDSCQYNQFFIDYSHDQDPKVHSAKDAWVLARDSAGDKSYQGYKEKIERIRNVLNTQSVTRTNTI